MVPVVVTTGATVAVTFCANSDVSVNAVNAALLFVAVALMSAPPATGAMSVALIVARPALSVAMLA